MLSFQLRRRRRRRSSGVLVRAKGRLGRFDGGIGPCVGRVGISNPDRTIAIMVVGGDVERIEVLCGTAHTTTREVSRSPTMVWRVAKWHVTDRRTRCVDCHVKMVFCARLAYPFVRQEISRLKIK
eukprot:947850-Prymnesium_polylepis.1